MESPPQPRTPEMEAAIAHIHGNPAFSLENVAAKVAAAVAPPLPPLPATTHRFDVLIGESVQTINFTADQMRAYALAAHAQGYAAGLEAAEAKKAESQRAAFDAKVRSVGYVDRVTGQRIYDPDAIGAVAIRALQRKE